MKMTKLATLFLTATLTLASGSVLAAETSSSGNGDANAAASAGQVALMPNRMSPRTMSITAKLITGTRIPAARCCTLMVPTQAP